jgi:hypothetical protein
MIDHASTDGTLAVGTAINTSTWNSWRAILRGETAPPPRVAEYPQFCAAYYRATDIGSLRNDTVEANGISLPGKSPADV